MFSNQLVALALCTLPVLAAPTSLLTVQRAREAIPGQYIVTFKDGVNRPSGVSDIVNKISSESKVTYQWDIINGFAATFTDADLELVRAHPDVAAIEQDGKVYINTIVTQ